MSIRTMIVIHECDSCYRIAVCKDDASFADFDLNWFSGMKDYCGFCRGLPHIAILINAEKKIVQENIDRWMAEKSEDLRKRLEAKQEGVWPEYVN